MNLFGLCAALLVLASEPRLLIVSQALTRASSALNEGRPSQALLDLQIALEVQPRDTKIVEKLIESASSAGRPEVAAAYLRQLAAETGWSSERYRQMGGLIAARGDLQQAVVYWQASLTDTADDIPTLRKIADGLLSWHDWDEAAEALTRLTTLDPNNEQALYRLGLLLAPTDSRRALNTLNRAADNPRFRRAATAINAIYANYGSETPGSLAFRLGVALMNLQAWLYAEHALTVSVGQEPDNPVALAFLGMTQAQQGRDGWARISQALALAPTDPMVNYALAVHWRLAGDPDQALSVLSQAAALAPTNAAIAAEIGTIYRLRGQFSEAAHWLNLAASLAPSDAGFQALLATFYADENYNLAGEGLEIIRKAADQAPDDPDLRASLGWALVATGRPDLGKIELDRALQLDPDNARARYFFGVFLETRGDVTGAVGSYLVAYREGAANGFKDRAARALQRLGYKPPA
jgi:Flp pilus assembly protein TadD